MAISLNGIDQHINIEGYTPNTEVSISFWLRLDSTGVVQRLLGSNGDFELRTQPAVNPALVLDFFGTGAPGVTLLTAGVWVHVVCLGSASTDTSQVYIDGVLDATNVGQTGTATGPTLAIGRTFDNVAQFADATYADFRVYNRVLSANEIQSIYAARGHDDIVDGLDVRYTFKEKPESQIASPFIDQATAQAGSTTSVTVAVPTHSDGDLLVAFIGSGGDGSGTPPNVTAPVGWTLGNAGNTDLPATASTPSVWFYYRTASSEPANYTFTANQTNAMIGAILSYDQNQLDSQVPQIVPSIINTGSSATPTAPSITLNDRSLVFRICCTDDDEVPVIPEDFTPDQTTFRFALEQTGGGNGCSLSVVEQILPPGATGTAVFVPDGSEQWGCLTANFIGARLPILDLSNNRNDGFPVNDPTYNTDELSLRKKKR